jgi:N-acetylmuramoyl-L-alanine amidase CwlD
LGLAKTKWILFGNWLLLYCTIFLVNARPCLAEGPRFINICLEGRQLSSEFQAVAVNGAHFVNLPFLRVFFQIATSWNQTDTQLYFKFGTYHFKMYASKTTYYVNGKKRTLPVAPFIKNSEFWIPVDFLSRLGLTVTERSADGPLSLEWKANYLLGIENINYKERPAFLIVTAKKFNLKQYALSNPKRLVLELAGTKPHFSMPKTLPSSNPLVKRVRIKTIANVGGCLVFDLTKSAGCRVIQNPIEPNRMILIFNYFINDVQLLNRTGDAKIRIESSFPADYKVTYPESNQLLVKFSGAIFPKVTKVIEGDHQKFHSIRIEQDDLNTVNVLVELVGKENFSIERSRLNPTWLEINKPSIIKEVNWKKTKTGSILTIGSNSELTENIRMLPFAKQLLIDLENAQFDSNLPQTLPVAKPVKSLVLLPVAANVARIELNLTTIVTYDVLVSADRRQIKILIKNSNLRGKTIVIDPGHGGVDTGACGKQNTTEKKINLEVALKLKRLLKMAGAKVLLTRNSDVFISLYERCHFANKHQADLFISIHANSHPDPNIRGIEIFHFKGQARSKKMAQKVLNRLTKTTGLKPLGVKTNRFVVIRKTRMPSILVELGFLSNYQEESIIKSAAFKDKAAWGILQGLLDL